MNRSILLGIILQVVLVQQSLPSETPAHVLPSHLAYIVRLNTTETIGVWTDIAGNAAHIGLGSRNTCCTEIEFQKIKQFGSMRSQTGFRIQKLLMPNRPPLFIAELIRFGEVDQVFLIHFDPSRIGSFGKFMGRFRATSSQRLPFAVSLETRLDQFHTPVPYDQATPKGFLTRAPSKRAKLIMERVQERLESGEQFKRLATFDTEARKTVTRGHETDEMKLNRESRSPKNRFKGRL